MQTSKRILAALLSYGMVTAVGQTVLLAQTDTTTSSTQPTASAPTDATTPTTQANASPPSDTTTSTTQATILAPDESDISLEFAKGEFNLSPFGTYVDQAGGRWGAGVAGTYFLTDKIGIGAATYWTDTGGTFFDNLIFEGYFRLPLKRVAPYAVAALGYQFDHTYWFETIGGGIDFRAFKRLDAFADLQWRFANSDKSGNGALLRFGLRFNLK